MEPNLLFKFPNWGAEMTRKVRGSILLKSTVGPEGLAGEVLGAGLGAVWGEDPRYVRDRGASFGHRLGHAAKLTFMAENRDGNVMPAYARFIAIPGSNFLSNAWRAPGDDTVERATIRTGLGFLDRFGSNVFDEFWPDFRQKLFRRSADQARN
jgi:hypothetical protein